MAKHRESRDASATRRAPRIHSRSPAFPVAAVFLLLASVSSTAAQSCIQPPDGIFAWWPGDTDATDIANDNDAQLQNGATAGVAGHTRGAFQFDGINDIAQTSVLLPSQGTIELWVNPSSLSAVHGLIGTFGTANGDNRLWLTARGPQGGFGVGADTLVVNTGSCCDNEIITPSPLVVGTWTHVALTFDYDHDVYTLYINGQFAASSTAPRDRPTHAVSFGGLASDFGQFFFFPGRLDEVTLYSRVLNQSEILAIYNAGSAGKCTPLPDADGDGVPDAKDVCPGTVIPEAVPTIRLGVNRFALTNNDTTFDTVAPPGRGPQQIFTTEKTKGCSCEQIIGMLGLGQGHRNSGCSIGAMREWVDMVNP